MVALQGPMQHTIAVVGLLLLAAATMVLAEQQGSTEEQLQTRAPAQSVEEDTYIAATELFDPTLNALVACAVEDVDDTTTGAALGRYTPRMPHSGQHRALLRSQGCLSQRCVPGFFLLLRIFMIAYAYM